MKRAEINAASDRVSRPPVGKRRSPRSGKRRLSEDETEFRVFAVAAGAAIVVLIALVAALVSQLP